MEITPLDFALFNLLSYLLGVGTGLIVCCKNKDKLMIKSRSIDNINGIYREHPPSSINNTSSSITTTPSITPSAPHPSTIQAQPIKPQVTKITLE